MKTELHLDYETRSVVDLNKAGAHVYFEHPSTDVLCAAYAFDKEEPQIWRPFERLEQRVVDHIESGGIITAWNASFERLASKHVMIRKHGWPAIDDTQFRCTMTEAFGMSFPGKLERAAPAMGLKIAKDEKGHRIMMQMCKPRAPRKGEEKHCKICRGMGCDKCYGLGTNILWYDDEERHAKLEAYCMQDVRVEAACGDKVLRLRPLEQKLYFLDMKINDRGVRIDKALCKAAQKVVETATDRLDKELKRVTDNDVSAVSNTTQLCQWLKSRGVDTDSVDKEHVEDLLILELPDDCRRALEIRQEGAKTSTAKINSMILRRQKDGRMRGNVQFYGAASTGRWAARGAQLQNLPRPVILGDKKSEPTPLEEQIREAIDSIFQGSSVMLELLYGKPLTLVADTIRSMICADPGNDLMSSDFKNIEGRVVAWLAGQEDKLDAFRAFDDGTGADLYLIAASGVYNVPVKEAKPFRQIGKVCELSLGFQGGPRAFAKMAKNYGVRIAKLYDGIWANADNSLKDKAAQAWDDRGRKTGMSMEGWLASEVIKLAWRAKNYKIEAYWHDIEEAAITAVKHPGTTTVVENNGVAVRFKMAGTYLFCQLPSGRALCYPFARLVEGETPWGETKYTVRYKAVDQFTKQWTDKAFYGGLGVENITQAVARDIMAEAMLRVDEAGYAVVLTVHDEVVCEIPEDFGSMEEYNDIMVEMPSWAAGLPVTADGWRGKRYRKG